MYGTRHILKEEFRSNTEVLARLAQAFYENRSLKKTQLYFISRTNWKSFDKYLIWLRNKNYIECKTDGKEERYCLTDTGRDMFNMISKFHEHIRSSKTIAALFIFGFVCDYLNDVIDFVT